MELRDRIGSGRLLMTIGIKEMIDGDANALRDVAVLLNRHMSGDWGDVCEEDAEANDEAAVNGDRLMSSYRMRGRKVWVITEAGHDTTTIMFPSEY